MDTMTTTNHDQDVLVIGYGHFGLGADVATAKRNFTRYGGRLRDGYIVYTFGDAIVFDHIDGWGGVHWTTATGEDYDPDNADHQPVVDDSKAPNGRPS